MEIDKRPSLLEVDTVSKKFGGVLALESVSLRLEPGYIYGLIGPNGSGKTTMFNVVTGFMRPEAGRIFLGRERIDRLSPNRIERKGIARTFQLTRVFMKMTVIENLMAVSHSSGNEQLENADKLLRLVELDQMKGELASVLSYGQRKQLEFARALINKPRLLLLDEPMAGLTQTMIRKMSDYIIRLYKDGMTILIIEHNLSVIMGLCQKVFVLDHGKKIAEGTPAEIRKDENVIHAYLGD